MIVRRRFFWVLAHAIAVLAAIHPAAAADPLAEPAGQIILSVSGKIDVTNRDGIAAFDLALLDSLPQTTIRTSNPWEPDPVAYKGVLGRDLLARLGAKGREVIVTAINDYRVAIPAADFERYNVVLATRREGTILSIREKGPIFVMYPFSDVPALRNDTIYARCIWQLKSIDVR